MGMFIQDWPLVASSGTVVPGRDSCNLITMVATTTECIGDADWLAAEFSRAVGMPKARGQRHGSFAQGW